MVGLESIARTEAVGLEHMVGMLGDGVCLALDDAVLRQLVKLQMVEGLPWADDSDVCGAKPIR